MNIIMSGSSIGGLPMNIIMSDSSIGGLPMNIIMCDSSNRRVMLYIQPSISNTLGIIKVHLFIFTNLFIYLFTFIKSRSTYQEVSIYPRL